MLKKEKRNSYLTIKSFFDIIASLILLLVTSWLIIIIIILSSLDTRSFGLFKQIRVGKNKKMFTIYKIKTIRHQHNELTPSSLYGFFLRKSKIDELPQLYNILKGDMSFVGPRPDVPGYADKLIGKNLVILNVKPGLTGPASIKYRNEEELLSSKSNPKEYNDEFIWPRKIEINKQYVETMSFKNDLYYLLKTFI